jgi:hypothetical protein
MHAEQKPDDAAVVFTNPYTVFIGIVLGTKLVYAFGNITFEGKAVVVFFTIQLCMEMYQGAEVAGAEVCADGDVVEWVGHGIGDFEMDCADY